MMIAEVLLVLAGHSSSLFPVDHKIDPILVPFLHPGERQCLESLCVIAFRYREIKRTCSTLASSPSRYICALCAALNQILRDEYENLVVDTEAKILNRDSSFVSSGSFVPLSSIRATFSEWDAPLATLESLTKEVERDQDKWKAGPLIDMLMARSKTGVHRISSILGRLSRAVQTVWRAQLIAFLIHGSLSAMDPIGSTDYALFDHAIPSCVSAQTRSSISYVGRAIGTVKSAKWHKQLPRSIASEHTAILASVLPEDQHTFDRVIADIRTNVSEWMWLNVLTRKDVEEAVDSLANYFLLRNGEFGLSLIRELERLKASRLTARTASTSIIREQDLHLALLRASLGTTAQHDPSLSRLRFHLPSGPLQPLLPSLIDTNTSVIENVTFDDLLLGTPLLLTYTVSWPLDLFLHPQDLQVYAAIFSYLSSLRKTHTQIHTCWTSLSNAQRARRRWTGLGEGGTLEDLEFRHQLLRCGWGLVREMNWFLDSLLGYVMIDVVDVEWARLKKFLGGEKASGLETSQSNNTQTGTTAGGEPNSSGGHTRLDFTTLRTVHNNYLERVLTGSLLSNQALTSVIRSIFKVCERFAAQMERWGGDVLPQLLFEGSLANSDEKVGDLVRERLVIVSEINDMLRTLLEAFYEQLSLSTSQQPFTATGDASKSVLMNMSTANISGFHTFIRQKRGKGMEGDGEVRRHVERLLLRLDFNGEFSRFKTRVAATTPEKEEILKGLE